MVVNIELPPESLHAEGTASGEKMTSQKVDAKWKQQRLLLASQVGRDKEQREALKERTWIQDLDSKSAGGGS